MRTDAKRDDWEEGVGSTGVAEMEAENPDGTCATSTGESADVVSTTMRSTRGVGASCEHSGG